ncbi:hypothetical protein IC744_16325 [Microbacterium hominis]|uniref:hypothetical protein n=1 Tax=Microbacterium TaxID=33882 RepID=UPI00168B9D4D|nr:MULTISPECIES: hypothetical protein [Microbacterium]QOC24828.1 hypothetical protein IC745_10575 [Microbacterium hominis]QOC28881.1 hypothetical protein IC744_16325 [Microbacterium hominis]QYF98920.1 hypothetical protein KY498_06820 [Microbacterium sp. PAMC21962]
MTSARKTTRRFVKDRAEFRARCAEVNAPCWICGERHIDYDAPSDDYTNGDRFELDHYYPVSTHPQLQHDPANFRASTHDCNNERSNGPPRPGLGVLSQAWT